MENAKEKTQVSIKTYGNYSSDNYGAHALQVNIGALEICFSYKTPIAFRAPGKPLAVSENCWGPTTGKHLNAIDGGNKKGRMARAEFEKALNETLESIGIAL